VNHRRAILALFVVAAAITGTTGFSTLQSDRTVDVQVAGDDEAYLQIVETGTQIKKDKTGAVLKLTNQFSESVDLSISVTTDDDIQSQGLDTRSIDPSKTAKLEVKCSQESSGTITVDIEASGDEISFEKSGHEVDVDCKPSPTPTPTDTTTGS
jgi:hypothetical protein